MTAADRAELADKLIGPVLNGWPEGTRTLTCLRCGRRFRSASKAVRQCGACRGAESGDARGTLALGRAGGRWVTA